MEDKNKRLEELEKIKEDRVLTPEEQTEYDALSKKEEVVA